MIVISKTRNWYQTDDSIGTIAMGPRAHLSHDYLAYFHQRQGNLHSPVTATVVTDPSVFIAR